MQYIDATLKYPKLSDWGLCYALPNLDKREYIKDIYILLVILE